MATWIPQMHQMMMVADPAKAAGVAVGRILAVAVLIALVVLVIVLIGRRKRKKRNQQHNANPYGPQR
jgi:uncharacterized membrane protein YhfC